MFFHNYVRTSVLRALSLCGLAAVGATPAPGQAVSDSFEYADQAAFVASWTDQTGTAEFTLQNDGGHTGGKYIRVNTASATPRINKTFTAITPTDAQPLIVEHWMRVPNTNAGRFGMQVNQAGHIVSFGSWNVPAGAGWYGRFVGSNGLNTWFHLGGTRVANEWTRLTMEVKSKAVNFYENGVYLGTADERTANWPAIGTVQIGFAVSTTVAADVDDVLVYQAAAPAAIAIVDGVGTDPGTFATLSDAVAFTDSQPAANGLPHQIFVEVNSTPIDDGQIVISKPTIIFGDADGDGTSVDIPVDAAAIAGQTDAGAAGKYYIELAAEGAVTISNLNIHTNGGAAVSGIATLKPAAGVGEYSLENVKFSGSTAGAYLPVDVNADQLTAAGTAIWNPATAGEGVINIVEAGGAGTYNVTVTDCHAGLSSGCGLSISKTTGDTTISGGAFAHATGEACVYITGQGITFTGSDTSRVRAFWSKGSEVFVIDDTGVVDLMEYVDCGMPDAAFNASPIALFGGEVTAMKFCRAYVDSAGGGATFYASGNSVANVFDSTFHGEADALVVSITNANSGSINFTDCIFTSEDGLGTVYVGGNTGPYTFTNCGLPTDGYVVVNETLDPASPITYQDATAQNATTVANSVTASPHYQVSPITGGVSNYDYSDAGAGNGNYLRPGNSAAYTAVASDGGNLTGGAGGTAVPVTLSRFSIE